MERTKFSVIGAGVIGLSVAESISSGLKGDVVVFEKHPSFGQETSSRNSEVIHAGLYYPPNSLKSRLCIAGNRMLYEFCEQKNVPHKKCGKLLVAVDPEEDSRIKEIFENASKAGVDGIKLITGEEAKSIEPGVFCTSALLSENTGIVDSHALMESLFDSSLGKDVMFVFGSEIISIQQHPKGYILKNSNGEEVLSRYVINCSGLSCDKTAAMAGLDVDQSGYRIHYCKGDYFSVSGGKDRISRLIYPPPNIKGRSLGIHATLNISGDIRLGPDAAYVDSISYDVDAKKAPEFFVTAKRYLPWLEESMLSPDTSGVRPKLQGPDDGFRDFVIKEESEKGLPRFINLIGIESPGLTSCLAIGEQVKIMIEQIERNK